MNNCCSRSYQKNILFDNSGTLSTENLMNLKRSAYSLKKSKSSEENESVYYEEIEFNHKRYNILNIFPWIKIKCFRMKNKSKLIILKIENINSSDIRRIIYTPTSFEDIGVDFPFLVDLSTYFKINIYTYQNLYTYNHPNFGTEMTEVLYCVRNYFSTNKDNIILFSHSFGAIPSLKAAIEEKSIQALILISTNISTKIKYDNLNVVKCPVFLIHGKKDKSVKYMQAIQIGNKLKFVYEWYPKNGDHYNITAKYRTKLYSKLKLFFEYVKTFKTLNDNNDDLVKQFSDSKNTNIKGVSPKNISFKFEDNFIFSQVNSRSYFDTTSSRNMNCYDPLVSHKNIGVFKLEQEDNLNFHFLDKNNYTFLKMSGCSLIKEEEFPFEKKDFNN